MSDIKNKGIAAITKIKGYMDEFDIDFDDIADFIKDIFRKGRRFNFDRVERARVDFELITFFNSCGPTEKFDVIVKDDAIRIFRKGD